MLLMVLSRTSRPSTFSCPGTREEISGLYESKSKT
jgi:hypothetical protein